MHPGQLSRRSTLESAGTVRLFAASADGDQASVQCGARNSGRIGLSLIVAAYDGTKPASPPMQQFDQLPEVLRIHRAGAADVKN